MNAETPVTESDVADAEKWRKRRRIRGILMLAAPVVVVVGSLWFYLTGGRYESTENAQLQTGMVAISASVPGKVTSVDVGENQLVRTGQILFTVNAETYSANLAESEAELAAARTGIAAKRADYVASLSAIGTEEAKLAFARSEVSRQSALLKEGISSRTQYDAAVREVRTATANIAAARARSESLKASLAGNVGGPLDIQPAVRKAAAQLEQSRIALNDSTVRAPIDGVVTKVHQLQPGNYVTPGKPVFMLTGTKYWVVANFKENQLRYMRVGQPATVKVDAFPDFELKGHIASFSPGTGNAFSILPAENATGNWVKVVQRLPVEIAIDQVPQGLPLHMGLSVEVTVDTGHKRHLFGKDEDPAPPQPAARPKQ
ncbi:MAG: HlyD family secretion protein [Novosphingobium sp.]